MQSKSVFGSTTGEIKPNTNLFGGMTSNQKQKKTEVPQKQTNTLFGE